MALELFGLAGLRLPLAASRQYLQNGSSMLGWSWVPQGPYRFLFDEVRAFRED